jgi:hypothetical protein
MRRRANPMSAATIEVIKGEKLQLPAAAVGSHGPRRNLTSDGGVMADPPGS